MAAETGPERLILRAPQHPMVQWLVTHPRSNLWAGMGIGKTTAALMALDILRLLDMIGDDPTLVLAPKRVAEDTWPDEVARWSNFAHYRIQHIPGELARRPQALAQKADIYTISYDHLPWLVEQCASTKPGLSKWPFRQVVADESDKLKGFRTKQGRKRAHALALVAHNCTKRWINLTGTPMSNGLKDLWGQQWFIDRGQRLGTSFEAFKRRWFMRDWGSGRSIIPLAHSEEEIKGLLRDCTLTIDPKDYFDLKEPKVEVVKVKLPPYARKVYRDLQKELYAELITGHVEVLNEGSLVNKCLQLANGNVYTTYPDWEPVHSAKLEALESIVAESGGMPLLVSYQFKPDLARLKRAFPRAVELSTKRGMEAFKAGDSPMGLAHPQSVGDGVNGLERVTNILVRYGRGWSLRNELQLLERIGPMRQHQAGLDRLVYVYDIIAADTTDEAVREVHRTNRRVLDVLLEFMKRQ